MPHRMSLALAAVIVAASLARSAPAAEAADGAGDEAWRFVSMPDFLNVDLDYPQDGWEESLSFILDSVKAEKGEFLIVPGDLVMGHWHGEPDGGSGGGIEHYAERYYAAWKARMKAHGLTCYTAVGDHEIGDNPWDYPGAAANVARYKRAFRDHMAMPLNGPEHLSGTAFYWVHRNVLFVSVDVFETNDEGKSAVRTGVTGEQLAWFERVLDDHRDVDHVIVMGHAPVLGPVRQWSSSGLMVEGGRESPFWKAMAGRGVALYLCGEVHAITCTERDDVQQIAHGGLIGYNRRTNYLVVNVYPDRLELTIKEIDLVPSGPKLWQPGTNRPLERVDIEPAIRDRGFVSVGTLTIDTRVQPRAFRDPTGYFLKRLETSTERGGPYEINKALPRIGIDGAAAPHRAADASAKAETPKGQRP